MSFFENKKAVVFDFDGVLLESSGIKTWAFGELYKKYGKEVQDKVLKYQIDNGGVNRADKFRYFHEVILNLEISSNEINSLSNKFRELIIEKLKLAPLALFSPEVLSMLKKKEFLLYCVSASPVTELAEILEYKNLRNYFIKIYGGGASKEENFELLSLEEKLDFSDMVYVGDSEIDLISSKSKNIDFVGYGNSTPEWGVGQCWINNWKEVMSYYER